MQKPGSGEISNGQPEALDPIRSAAIRKRLLERARREGQTPLEDRGRGGPSSLTLGGWLAAAGLASLLLTHHAFHEPLNSGWIAAAVLGLVTVGLLVQLMRQKKRLDELRRSGDSG